ncbi:hypothetical protein V5799_025386 [Amblyomma americanum]|uniref:Uncharacterized protein n=1 Tax=Amblyomma americanum TaxID=6943 RepID=A0AAQ4E9E5_AMBAM
MHESSIVVRWLAAGSAVAPDSFFGRRWLRFAISAVPRGVSNWPAVISLSNSLVRLYLFVCARRVYQRLWYHLESLNHL